MSTSIDSAAPRAPAIEILTLKSVAEVRALPGFKADSPVSKDSYAAIAGDYHVAPDEFQCCFLEPTGKLCGESHFWGFIARLKDGSLTVVGNACAREKLGASDEKFKADLSRYLNEKRRQEALTRLASLVAGKPERLSGLRQVEQDLRALHQRMASFRSELGSQTLRRLEALARTGGQARVMVTAVNFKDYTDEEGNAKQERSAAPAQIGTLNGLSVIMMPTILQTTSAAIQTVASALDQAERVTPATKTSKLDSLIAEITDSERIAQDCQRHLEAERVFLANDFSLLCFLVADRVERYDAAKLALRQAGQQVGKDRAKAWLADKEKQIRTALKADSIEIGH